MKTFKEYVLKEDLRKEIAKNFNDDIKTITITKIEDGLVFFKRVNADMSAKITKTGKLKKNSIRVD